MHTARLATLLTGLLLLSTAGGCAIGSQRTGRIIDPVKIAQVKVGEATKQDVLNLFGPPTAYNRIGSARFEDLGRLGTSEFPRVEVKSPEDVFVYEYVEDNEWFFTVLLFTQFDREQLADTLMVFFDVEDKVKYMAFTKQTTAEPGDED